MRLRQKHENDIKCDYDNQNDQIWLPLAHFLYQTLEPGMTNLSKLARLTILTVFQAT